MIQQLFSLLNFGLIVGLGVYAFRRYMVGGLQGKVDQEHALIQAMHHEHEQLKREQKHAEESIKEQEDTCIHLKRNIDLWSKAVIHQAQKEQEMYEKIYAQMKSKVEQQNNYYALSMQLAAVKDGVEQQLLKESAQFFQNEQKGHAYIQTILKRLK